MICQGGTALGPGVPVFDGTSGALRAHAICEDFVPVGKGIDLV